MSLGEIVLEKDRESEVVKVTFTIDGQILHTIPTACNLEGLNALKNAFSLQLQDVKNDIGNNLTPSWTSVNAAMRRLWQAGNNLTAKLFPYNYNHFREYWQEFIQRCGTTGESPKIQLIGISNPDPRILGPETSIPFEFLPLFRPHGAKLSAIPPIASQDVLESFLSYFPGNRCIMTRVLGSSGEPRKRVPHVYKEGARQKIPVKFFRDRTLPGVIREERLLRKTHRTVMSFDSWPGKKGGTCAELVKILWRVNFCTKGKQRDLHDQVHHFAAHFDMSSTRPDKHFLQLSGAYDSVFKITLSELLSELQDWFQDEVLPGHDSRPLVFVNTCGSSTTNVAVLSSLPEIFIHLLRSQGYIGCETTMSDSVAPKFANDFYQRLLRGAPIGRALHDARRSLVRLYSNPLGLFYVSYANPDSVYFQTESE